MLTTSCRGDSDSDSSDDEGFEIERDIFDDVADELDDKTPSASRPERSWDRGANELPDAQRKNERKEKLQS